MNNGCAIGKTGGKGNKMREKKVMREVMSLLMDLDCGTIGLEMNWTDGSNICPDGVVITQCPPIVIEILVKKGFLISLYNGKLHIDKFDIQ